MEVTTPGKFANSARLEFVVCVALSVFIYFLIEFFFFLDRKIVILVTVFEKLCINV